MDMDKQRITTKRPVIEEADVSKPKRLKLMIAVVVFLVPVSIILLSQGISGMRVQEGPTFETTAVVSDRETERRSDSYGKSYTVYDVYLDFSNSQMDPEIVDLLVQHQQGIRVRSREVFDISTGKTR